MNQKDALDILKMGQNVFLTGPAGSGKTFLLNQYIKYLKKKKVRVAITASTGIAATHIGGITVHSWSGMGIAKRLSKTEFKTILNRKYLQNRLAKTKVLIIDEISMLDADRLDLLNNICQAFRASVLPFGGMQVVFCGDFFQLPPVNGVDEKNEYAFLSEVWNNSDLKICYLDEQHRHSDKKFIKVLNDLRNSQVKESTLKTLKSRIKQPVRGNIVPTRLYSTNLDVNTINNYELEKIKKAEYEYQMDFFYEDGKKHLADFLIKNCTAPERLVLKIGAVVMFVKNKFKENGQAEYVNGTLGKVIGFGDVDKYPIIETYDGKKICAYPSEWAIEENEVVMAKISQLPLRLAWAITIHKSQGMSLDEVVMDLSKSFDYGMGYVALSRVRSLEGMCLLGLNKMALEVSPVIKTKDKEFLKESLDNLKEFESLDVNEVKKKQKEFLKSTSKKDSNDLFDKVFK